LPVILKSERKSRGVCGDSYAADRYERAHSGQHPRMGATDVVPFIPIKNMTMAECVTLAKEVGANNLAHTSSGILI
jgi:glutamate formiminotransferase